MASWVIMSYSETNPKEPKKYYSGGQYRGWMTSIITASNFRNKENAEKTLDQIRKGNLFPIRTRDWLEYKVLEYQEAKLFDPQKPAESGNKI